MNDILKFGIMWILISIPFIYFLDTELWRNILVGTIGIILTIVGVVINEYQNYNWEKSL